MKKVFPMLIVASVATGLGLNAQEPTKGHPARPEATQTTAAKAPSTAPAMSRRHLFTAQQTYASMADYAAQGKQHLSVSRSPGAGKDPTRGFSLGARGVAAPSDADPPSIPIGPLPPGALDGDHPAELKGPADEVCPTHCRATPATRRV